MNLKHYKLLKISVGFIINSIFNRIIQYRICQKIILKVNSLQEACAKRFAVHVLKFEILQNARKDKTKTIKMLNLLVKNSKVRVRCSLFHFFLVFCNIPNSIWMLMIKSTNLNCFYKHLIFEKKITQTGFSAENISFQVGIYNVCVGLQNQGKEMKKF